MDAKTIDYIFISIQLLGAIIILGSTFFQNRKLHNLNEVLSENDKNVGDLRRLEHMLANDTNQVHIVPAGSLTGRIMAMAQYCRTAINLHRIVLKRFPVNSEFQGNIITEQVIQEQLNEAQTLWDEIDQLVILFNAHDLQYHFFSISVGGYTARSYSMGLIADAHFAKLQAKKEKWHRNYVLWFLIGSLLTILGSLNSFN